jgi:CRP-like cAMP-binding protein
MLAQPSIQHFPRTPFAPPRIQRAAPILHTPSQNRILAALPPHEYARLLPNLEPVSLAMGQTLHGAGSCEKHLYFLTTSIVSRVYIMENGEAAEFAITGNEGAIGIAAILGGESTPNQSMVLSAGHAYRLRTDLLKSEFAHGGALLPLLLRYTHALIAQTGQIAACNRHHSIEQRLSRWLLSCVDRAPSNDLTMTQDLLANTLGVRREGVTEAAQKLQKAGAIHYRRGHVTVLDRAGLQARACECYSVIKSGYDKLFSGLGSAPPGDRQFQREDKLCSSRRVLNG